MSLKFTPAIIFLIAVNLIPIFGVIYAGWDISVLFCLYWIETVIIGVLNIPKMLFTGGGIGKKIFIIPFFVVHFGIFSGVHFAFLNDMFDTGAVLDSILAGGTESWGVAAFVLSHIFSMGVNFFGKGEYKGRPAEVQMFYPYTRVVIMHLVIIFGGMLAQLSGQPILALIVLILLKIGADIGSHSFAHRLGLQTVSD